MAGRKPEDVLAAIKDEWGRLKDKTSFNDRESKELERFADQLARFLPSGEELAQRYGSCCLSFLLLRFFTCSMIMIYDYIFEFVSFFSSRCSWHLLFALSFTQKNHPHLQSKEPLRECCARDRREQGGLRCRSARRRRDSR